MTGVVKRDKEWFFHGEDFIHEGECFYRMIEEITSLRERLEKAEHWIGMQKIYAEIDREEEDGQ